MLTTLLAASVLCSLTVVDEPPVTFSVSFPETLRAEPATGRLVVYLIRDGSSLPPGEPPSNGPFWSDLQPMFGTDAVDLAPGRAEVVDARAAASPSPLADLAPGKYTAQAVLDVNRLSSNWHMEAGNLYSGLVSFEFAKGDAPRTIEIVLSDAIPKREYPNQLTAGIELFEVRSELLSKFRGRDVMLRAGVVPPVDRDPARRYAAVYEVPGFGGDHAGAYRVAFDRKRTGATTIDGRLARSTFWIVLDPESENGHTLFADSANNGPCGEALVKELIPALEAKYNLAPRPEARLLRGHSSGGWSVLWLAITYPETFGVCWSSSPDPVDFRRFQVVDIYGQANMYQTDLKASFNVILKASGDKKIQVIKVVREASGLGLKEAKDLVEGAPKPIKKGLSKEDAEQLKKTLEEIGATVELASAGGGDADFAFKGHPNDLPSVREGGKPIMTIRDENGTEEVLGADNTSGQQWDSWLAVFGPRNERSHPAALYDPTTGVIDKAVAGQFKNYDIGERLRAEPGRIGLIFQQRIRLVVGDMDSFYLNEAVALLKPEVEKLSFFAMPEGRHGFIKIVPGADHGTVFGSAEIQAFPADMLDHLERNKLATAPASPAPPK